MSFLKVLLQYSHSFRSYNLKYTNMSNYVKHRRSVFLADNAPSIELPSELTISKSNHLNLLHIPTEGLNSRHPLRGNCEVSAGTCGKPIGLSSERNPCRGNRDSRKVLPTLKKGPNLPIFVMDSLSTGLGSRNFYQEIQNFNHYASSQQESNTQELTVPTKGDLAKASQQNGGTGSLEIVKPLGALRKKYSASSCRKRQASPVGGLRPVDRAGSASAGVTHNRGSVAPSRVWESQQGCLEAPSIIMTDNRKGKWIENQIYPREEVLKSSEIDLIPVDALVDFNNKLFRDLIEEAVELGSENASPVEETVVRDVSAPVEETPAVRNGGAPVEALVEEVLPVAGEAPVEAPVEEVLPVVVVGEAPVEAPVEEVLPEARARGDRVREEAQDLPIELPGFARGGVDAPVQELAKPTACDKLPLIALRPPETPTPAPREPHLGNPAEGSRRDAGPSLVGDFLELALGIRIIPRQFRLKVGRRVFLPLAARFLKARLPSRKKSYVPSLGAKRSLGTTIKYSPTSTLNEKSYLDSLFNQGKTLKTKYFEIVAMKEMMRTEHLTNSLVNQQVAERTSSRRERRKEYVAGGGESSSEFVNAPKELVASRLVPRFLVNAHLVRSGAGEACGLRQRAAGPALSGRSLTTGEACRLRQRAAGPALSGRSLTTGEACGLRQRAAGPALSTGRSLTTDCFATSKRTQSVPRLGTDALPDAKLLELRINSNFLANRVSLLFPAGFGEEFLRPKGLLGALQPLKNYLRFSELSVSSHSFAVQPEPGVHGTCVPGLLRTHPARGACRRRLLRSHLRTGAIITDSKARSACSGNKAQERVYNLGRPRSRSEASGLVTFHTSYMLRNVIRAVRKGTTYSPRKGSTRSNKSYFYLTARWALPEGLTFGISKGGSQGLASSLFQRSRLKEVKATIDRIILRKAYGTPTHKYGSNTIIPRRTKVYSSSYSQIDLSKTNRKVDLFEAEKRTRAGRSRSLSMSGGSDCWHSRLQTEKKIPTRLYSVNSVNSWVFSKISTYATRATA